MKSLYRLKLGIILAIQLPSIILDIKMKFIIFAIFVTFVVGCPIFGVDFVGADITSVAKVKTWQACARHCQNLLSCHYWTWDLKPDDGPEWYQRCYLKGSNPGTRNGNVISGRYDCLDYTG